MTESGEEFAKVHAFYARSYRRDILSLLREAPRTYAYLRERCLSSASGEVLKMAYLDAMKQLWDEGLVRYAGGRVLLSKEGAA